MTLAKNKTRFLAYTGISAALIAVLTQISVPMPSGVPVTLQTFAVAFVGCVFGAAVGPSAAAVYALLGAVGLPVFAGFKGGIAVLLGPTGGFIFGFIAFAALCGFYRSEKRIAGAALCLAGLAVCHILGTVQFSVVTGRNLISGALIASVPYLIKDVVSVAAAIALSEIIKKRMHI